MSSIETLLRTSTLAGNGEYDSLTPPIVKETLISENAMVVREGTIVNYNVKKDGYLTVDDNVVVTNFVQDVDVNLRKYVTLTLNVTPADVSVVLTAENGILLSDRIIKVPEKTYVYYTINKVGYRSKKGYVKVTEDTVYPVTLNDNAYTFTVNPTPDDSTVVLTAEHPIGEQQGNSIIVSGVTLEYPTSSVTYNVSKNGYESVIKTINSISSDTTVEITLKKYLLVTFNYTPLDSTLILETDTTKNWNSNTYYDKHALVSYENKLYNANTSHTSGSTFNIGLWDEVTSSIWVTYNTTLYYNLSRSGYKTVDSNFIVKADANLNIDLVSYGAFRKENENELFVLENNTELIFQKENEKDGVDIKYFTYTINPTPSDATVTLAAVGYTQVGNSITVPPGTIVQYLVYKENMNSVEGTETLTQNKTLNIALSYTSGYVLFESSTPGTYPIDVYTTQQFNIVLVGGGAGGASRKHNIIAGTDRYYNSAGGSGASITGTSQITTGTYNVVVGSGSIGNAALEDEVSIAAGGNTSVFNQTAGGGGAHKHNEISLGGVATTTLSGLVGQNGNDGVYNSETTNIESPSTPSHYGEYGKGGEAVYKYGENGGNGYVKITAV